MPLETIVALISGTAGFCGVFAAVALWETLRPLRRGTVDATRRWLANVALFLINAGLRTWVGPLLLLGAAVGVEANGWGVLPALNLPVPLGILAGFLLLDLFGYVRHRLLHAIPVLWRCHALHHADPDIDVTTAVRHHPFEVLLNLQLNLLFVALVGVPALAVGLYGGLVALLQFVQHGNVALPRWLQPLGWLVVTPELHRVHHSLDRGDSDSNFTNLLTIWDRLFGTFRPVATVSGFGIAELSAPEWQRLDRMLLLPFVLPSPATAAEAQ